MRKGFLNFRKHWLLVIISMGMALTASSSYAQDTEEDSELYDLSLEELMNIVIKSASQKEESVFDAPVDSYSITKEQIKRAGATSIPEALRLSPGVIVREAANGNYDIHLRGFDNLSRYSGTQDQANTLTLVMIDDRPVFNYNNGGTNWEALPIDIIDVERIEIVKGPGSPLFGPNAVTGVINIITKREQKDVHLSTHLSQGTPGTTIANLRAGKKIVKGLTLTLSGNYQKRERTDDLYYLYEEGSYTNNLDTAVNMSANYGQSSLSMEKYGVNAFLDYDNDNDLSLRLSGGYQQADLQKYYLNYGFSSLSPSGTRNSYIDLQGKYKGIGAKFSVINGYDHLVKNSLILVTESDFTNTNFVLDYDWTVSEKLHIRPSFNYQKASYNDSKYVGDKVGLYGGEKEISSYAVSLRGDYNPLENLRFIAAVRGDKFDIPDDYYISYQFALVHSSFSDKLITRIAHSRSNGGSFIGHSHLDARLITQVPTQPFPTTVVTNITGNGQHELPSIVNTELGIRGKISDHLNVDVTLFHQSAKNLMALAQTDSTVTFGLSGVLIDMTSQYVNIPLTARQNGATVTLNYVASAKFQFSPFVTLQKTDVENIPTAFTTNEEAANNIYNGFDDENHTTPRVYGGFYANYTPGKKWNINANSYYFSSHRVYSEQELITPSNEGEIDGKFILNLRVAYNVLNNLSLYANARNLLNIDSREQFGTDRIGSLYMAGLHYNLFK